MIETLVYITVGLLLIAGYYLFNKYRGPIADHHDEHHDEHHDTPDGVCCGRHTVCDKGYDNSNLYFDDEELDRYKERSENDYTDEEAEEFRQVLYTMKEEEVEEWVKCLQTRQIALPSQVKDEVLLILQ